jgi:peptide/nickel transport system permease protein
MNTIRKLIKEIVVAILILFGTTFTIYLLLGQTIYDTEIPGESGGSSIVRITGDYAAWVRDAVSTGYLGHSSTTNLDVGEIISGGFRQTFILVIGSLIVSILIAVPFGLYAALRPDSRFNRLFLPGVYLFSALPVFLLALFIRPFWVQHFGILDWTEAVPLFRLIGFFGIPILILGIADGVAGEMIKHVREVMTSIVRENYIRAVLARDANVWKHLFKSALVPVFTIITSRFSYALGGALIVEYIFFSRGISVVALDALKYRDPYVLLAIGMIFSVLIVCANVLNRFLLYAVDPRTRTG